MSLHARFVQWCNQNEIEVPAGAMSGLSLHLDLKLLKVLFSLFSRESRTFREDHGHNRSSCRRRIFGVSFGHCIWLWRYGCFFERLLTFLEENESELLEDLQLPGKIEVKFYASITTQIYIFKKIYSKNNKNVQRNKRVNL